MPSPLAPRRFMFILLLLSILCTRISSAATLRIVSYNIAADVDGYTTARPGLDTVLEAIGEQPVNGVVQPADIIGLEETTSNATTVAPLVATLNSYYGAGTYAASPYQGTEVGNSPSVGNGPNALIYNTKTVTLLGSVGVGTPHGSSNGEYRQVIRYQFQPVGGAAASVFYLYISHTKSSFSGTTAAVQAARNGEAQIIRADSATLPADSAILYTGDFNLDGSSEPAYATLTASGQGQGIDPLNNNPQNNSEDWGSATYVSLATESATSLRYRDDIQFLSPSLYNGTITGGLQYIAGSFRAFGNNGTTSFGGSINTSSNTALNNLQGSITPAAARAALTTASDHLPVVSDYTFATTGGVTVTPGTLQLAADTYGADESAGTVNVLVSRAAGSQGAVSVAYATADGTGLAGVDYTAVSGTLSWTDGDAATKSFTVPILDRHLTNGGTKTVQISLGSAGGGASLGTPSTATLTITDNDPVTVVAPVITSPTTAAGQVGTAFAYQITAANAPTSFAASGLPPGLILDAASGTISGTPTAAATSYVVLSASNPAGTGSTTLTLTVAAATVTPPVGALPTVTVAAEVATVTAGTGQVGSFVITRTGDLSAPLAVTFAIKGSAVNGTDYQLLTTRKNIKAGKAIKRVHVTPLPRDGIPAGGKLTVKIVLVADPAYTVGSPSTAKVKILYPQ